MRRPGLLHTSSLHVPTFDALIQRHSPDVRPLHVVDESLLGDAREHGPDAVAQRVAAHLRDLHEHGAQVVCCTCSTIGAVAERADVAVPVFRVDRPMAERAVRLGGRIAVVAALASTIEPTRDLLVEAARCAGESVSIRFVIAESAWARFESGDHHGYLDGIAAAARSAAPADVVVLAQASAAPARALLTDLAIPVLSSPELALERLAADG